MYHPIMISLIEYIYIYEEKSENGETIGITKDNYNKEFFTQFLYNFQGFLMHWNFKAFSPD